MRKLDEMADELRGELRRGDYLLAPGESAFPPKIRAALQSAYDLGVARAGKAEAALSAEREKSKRLREELLWLRNLASGVGKAGGDPELGEYEAAVDAADAALDARSKGEEPAAQ